jgi:hypothetical protein
VTNIVYLASSVQLVESLAASACTLTQEVMGSTPGADGLTQTTILSRSNKMSSKTVGDMLSKVAGPTKPIILSDGKLSRLG